MELHFDGYQVTHESGESVCILQHNNFETSCIYREVPEKDAKDYADSIHAIFVETSAKNAININEVFIEISECRCTSPGSN